MQGDGPARVVEDLLWLVRRHLRRDIAEGFRWVRHHAAVRTLVLTIFTFNITWGAAWSVLVLYATERLGLGAVGFGLVTTVGAVGGLAGTASYGWITRRMTPPHWGQSVSASSANRCTASKSCPQLSHR